MYEGHPVVTKVYEKTLSQIDKYIQKWIAKLVKNGKRIRLGKTLNHEPARILCWVENNCRCGIYITVSNNDYEKIELRVRVDEGRVSKGIGHPFRYESETLKPTFSPKHLTEELLDRALKAASKMSQKLSKK